MAKNIRKRKRKNKNKNKNIPVMVPNEDKIRINALINTVNLLRKKMSVTQQMYDEIEEMNERLCTVIEEVDN
jgi:hypothetical protein